VLRLTDGTRLRGSAEIAAWVCMIFEYVRRHEDSCDRSFWRGWQAIGTLHQNHVHQKFGLHRTLPSCFSDLRHALIRSRVGSPLLVCHDWLSHARNGCINVHRINCFWAHMPKIGSLPSAAAGSWPPPSASFVSPWGPLWGVIGVLELTFCRMRQLVMAVCTYVS
jgi:hypothetical protein